MVDSLALAKALAEGRLLGAGLDVIADEPQIHKDHPLVKERKSVPPSLSSFPSCEPFVFLNERRILVWDR